MAYPILAPNSTWFTQGGTTVKRASITEIEIKDSYTPDTSVTVVSSWDASAAKDGSIMCYVIGTKLIIAGNGSGKIAAHANSASLFADYDAVDFFTNVVNLIGAEFIDVSSVTTFGNAFNRMYKMTSINVTDWDTSSCRYMHAMFRRCKALTEIDVSKWNTSSCINMIYMFDECSSLTEIDVSKWDTSSCEQMTNMFSNCTSLGSIDISNWNVSSCTTVSYMFFSCTALTTIDVSNLDLSSCTDISYMFACCSSLEELDVSKWNISSCVYAVGIFEECSKLKNLDVSNWDLSSCINISFMFYNTPSLKEINVSNWDVSNVTTIDHFAAHALLKRKGMEKWNTKSLINANAAFHNCAEEELDLSGWDVSKVQFFCQMFENSPNLKRIKGLEKWNTSSGLGFDGMFERCYKLEEVDLSSFNTTKAKNNVSASPNGHKTATLKNMFLSCNNLKKVRVGPNFSINGDGTNTAAANKLILPTPSSTYIPGADGMWYIINGDSYAPNAMKDRTKETYYASFDIVANLDVIVKNSNLIDAARAIREKNGTTNRYTPSEFGAAIRAIVPRAIAAQARVGQVNVGEV